MPYLFLVGHIFKAIKSYAPSNNQAQNRTTYYAPNQLAQMRPNLRWQQQGGRGQGEQGAQYNPPIAGVLSAHCET